MSIKRLIENEKISGEIEVLSGLHIGAGSDEIHIGGVDNPVVRDPSGNPYIPGSSLKGKIRCLLELSTNSIGDDGGPYVTKEDDDPIARIFGNGKTIDEYKGGPTRVSFSDCQMINVEEMTEKGALTEEKAEVSINRLSGTVEGGGAAGGGGVRHMERVPRGARFRFEVTYKIFDFDGDGGEKDRDNLILLLIGMRLLEDDALGGSGSRGYGRIKFNLDKLPAFIKYEKLEEINVEEEIERFIKED